MVLGVPKNKGHKRLSEWDTSSLRTFFRNFTVETFLKLLLHWGSLSWISKEKIGRES